MSNTLLHGVRVLTKSFETNESPIMPAAEYPFTPENKTDLRDLWKFYQDGTQFWEYISSRMVEVEIEQVDEEIAPVRCVSFQHLETCCYEKLHWSKLGSDSLALTLATVISSRVKGPLLWVYLIGPSGSGKSLACDFICADKIHTKRINEFTGLYSGYKTGDPDKPDASLIAKLPGKALVVPDFTTILGKPATFQDNCYAELRAAYDGRADVHFKHDLTFEYKNITFPFVAGVTHEIHALRKSALGERFLKWNMYTKDLAQPIVRRAVDNIADAASDSLENNSTFDETPELHPYTRDVKAATLGYLQHLFQRIAGGVKVRLSEAFKRKLCSLASIVAAARGEVKRMSGADRDLVYRPVLETGSHVAGQLTKMAICLCVVLDREADDEILRLVTKLAMDTAHGMTFDIIRTLGNTPNGMTIEQLASKARIPPTSLRKLCEDLRELGVIEKREEENSTGVAGRSSHVLYLTEGLQADWDEIYPHQPAPRQLSKP